ncbi:MAG: asparaginase [Methylotenera sp.]|nr:asparaginase [Oligoflexia bacterium]
MNMTQLPRVLIVYTGGTFGMVASSTSTQLKIPKLNPASLRKRFHDHIPELRQLARCDVDVLMNRDSAHVGPADWAMLAERIRKRWDKYDGVVVLHGTDTLSYTASALSFLLAPCKKPVILTGAQKPLAALRTDARRNLISAVEIAAHGPRPQMNQVMIFFDDRLLQGNRARKESASDFRAFESPRTAPLAMVGTTIQYAQSSATRPLKRVPKLQPVFNEKIALLHVTPGFPSKVIADSLLDSVSALLLLAFPSGTAPTHDPAFMNLISLARKKNLPVIIATEGMSRASGLKIDPKAYAAGRELLQEGCYWAGEMTPECAFVKASWLLGQKDAADQFQKWWSTEFAGEGSGP